ncbi:MAG: hypothetical protein OXG53_17040, partial [Chloroflexi bacterium]|nr:hypothetical protein [Chloroflexota bacterium]
SGEMQFQWASDVARQFILAAEHPLDGARGFNLGGPPSSVERFVDVAKEALPGAAIEVVENPLPFPAGFDDSALRASFDTVYETPLEAGIAETIAHIQKLGDRIQQ